MTGFDTDAIASVGVARGVGAWSAGPDLNIAFPGYERSWCFHGSKYLHPFQHLRGLLRNNLTVAVACMYQLNMLALPVYCPRVVRNHESSKTMETLTLGLKRMDNRF